MDNLPPRDHNNPPDPIVILQSQLAETHTDLSGRATALAAMAGRLPEACDDVDTAQRLADGIKSCAAFIKNSEAARVSAKEPHLQASRAVDGWFKKLAEPVESVQSKMKSLLTVYQRKVEAEERRLREEAAAEADRVRREEERARRAAEAAAREAQLQAQEAERKQREAEEAARNAKTLAAKEAAAKAKAEAEAAEAAAQKARDVAAQQAATAAGAKVQAQDTKAAALERPAELTRTRTDLGSVASLVRTWGYEVVNEDEIPRMFLTVDDAAIKAFIKARTDKKTGVCNAKIPGVKLVEKHDTRVA